MVEKFDYDESVADAIELIEEFGRTATLKQTTNSGTAHDPTQSTAEHACTVVTLTWENKEIDGTLIKATDRKILISLDGLTVTPALGDKIVIGSETLRLVAPFKPFSPASTVVFYETNARAS